jgi:hypothetical protein
MSWLLIECSDFEYEYPCFHSGLEIYLPTLGRLHAEFISGPQDGQYDSPMTFRIIFGDLICFTGWWSMGSFLRKQPCYLFILTILCFGAHEAKTLSSDGMQWPWFLFFWNIFWDFLSAYQMLTLVSYRWSTSCLQKSSYKFRWGLSKLAWARCRPMQLEGCWMW